MMETTVVSIENEVNQAIQGQSFDRLLQSYRDQGEFFTVDSFLSKPAIDCFMAEVHQVSQHLNRNFIPGHKKGGSVSYYTLCQSAPSILSFYRDPKLIDWLSRIAGVPLMLCPDDDPHSCALYYYTEAGDHIGYHYDTSYYKGARYTLLLGLVDRSTSRLVCRLHTKDQTKETQELSLATDPGLLIFFNGDNLHHAVTPLGEDEERIVLTMQYVTNPEMGMFKRWYSNMKDAVGYFGWSALFRWPSH